MIHWQYSACYNSFPFRILTSVWLSKWALPSGKVFRQEYSPLRINMWTSFCGELSLYNDQSPWLVSNPRTLLVPPLNILVVAELFLFYFIFSLQWTPLAAYGNCALLHFYIPLLPSFKKKKTKKPGTQLQNHMPLCNFVSLLTKSWSPESFVGSIKWQEELSLTSLILPQATVRWGRHDSQLEMGRHCETSSWSISLNTMY